MEVDFVLTLEDEPTLMIEVKLSDRSTAKGLHYFNKRYGFPGVQLVAFLHTEN